MSKSKSRQSSSRRQRLAEYTNKTTAQAGQTTADAEKKTTSVASETTKGTTRSSLTTAEKPASAKLETSADKTTPNETSGAAKKTAKAITADEKPASAASISSASTLHRPTQPTPKALTRDAAKYERRLAGRQQRYLAQRRARRIKIFGSLAIILALVLSAGLTYYFVYQSQHANAPSANSSTAFQEPIYDSNNPPIDNVYCDQLEGSVEHIHMHLSIWIDGTQMALPGNIGIATDPQSGQPTCYYWLHVHPETPGVIHIEAPVTETFTLGQFLDEWNQQFNSLGPFPNELASNSGWTIWINGKVSHDSLDSVPLNVHTLVTIAYNSPQAKPDTTFAWNGL